MPERKEPMRAKPIGIQYFCIEIRPSYYVGPSGKTAGDTIRECKISVTASGQPPMEYHRIMAPHDFESFLDIFFEEAKLRIKEAMKEDA